mmetsp:Transcript_5210/g.15923  ORF Transcript_5210/g.15923 Transcript_5210/m.15923 type:complete len:325 (+) Transcript_5210:339-1313(+)
MNHSIGLNHLIDIRLCWNIVRMVELISEYCSLADDDVGSAELGRGHIGRCEVHSESAVQHGRSDHREAAQDQECAALLDEQGVDRADGHPQRCLRAQVHIGALGKQRVDLPAVLEDAQRSAQLERRNRHQSTGVVALQVHLLRGGHNQRAVHCGGGVGTACLHGAHQRRRRTTLLHEDVSAHGHLATERESVAEHGDGGDVGETAQQRARVQLEVAGAHQCPHACRRGALHALQRDVAQECQRGLGVDGRLVLGVQQQKVRIAHRERSVAAALVQQRSARLLRGAVVAKGALAHLQVVVSGCAGAAARRHTLPQRGRQRRGCVR